MVYGRRLTMMRQGSCLKIDYDMKNKFLPGLLALIGFSACDNAVSAYGTPNADYSVKGKVTDEAKNPLENIRVVLKPDQNRNYKNDTTYTNSVGEYALKSEGAFPMKLIQVIAEDIDGEDNDGSFAAQTEEVPIEKSDYKGGSGNWYSGKAEKTVNFELEKATVDKTD